MLPLLGMDNTEIIKLKLRQVPFNIDVSENKIMWEYCAHPSFEPETFNALDHYLDANSIMIDVGAWEGPFSLYAASICQKVFAIEPDNICAPRLKKQLALNPIQAERISFSQSAISSEDQSLELFSRNHFGDSASSLLKRARDNGDSIKVNAFSLSSFFSNHGLEKIDFIKMDTEGAEFDILPSAAPALKSVGNPTLLVAFHISYLKESILHQKVKNRLLAKLCLKFKDLLFNKKVEETMRNVCSSLSHYSFVLTADGTSIDRKSYKFKEDQQLIFTNIRP